MLNVKCEEKRRYHIYHILTLFYKASQVRFLEEHDETPPDLTVDMENEELCINFFGAEHTYEFKDRNLNVMRRALFLLLQEKTGKELPWGILIGIRPSKIIREMIDSGTTKEQIVIRITEEYLTREDKILLAYEVALKERELLEKVEQSGSCDIYIGMPFCPSRCIYCSFASNVVKGNRYKEKYLNLLQQEIQMIKEFIIEEKLTINNVYFGGGTPTAVSNEEFYQVIKGIHDHFIKDQNIFEFTVEAGRVDSLNEEKLRIMKEFDVSRISINPQTMNNETLKIIGRSHDAKEVKTIFYLARNLGFDNINMDLILGLPGENLSQIRYTLEEIKKLSPESITIHGLAIKRASILYEDLLQEKKYTLPTQKEMNQMFEEAEKTARDLSMKPYYMYRQKNMVGNLENVGYAIEGKENLYNVVMIEEVKTIIALGADGVTKKVTHGVIERFPNFKGLNDYTERFDEMMTKKLEFLRK
ncbi:MAG: coproporphyrinogen dehydrogenase HemZ [Clostridium sp.]|nr:coproporphyrinogen dehydrogenase HemZ [Clostridium sp.]